MNLLLIRHGIADDRFEFARRNGNDDERPLTEKGIARMRSGAAGLLRLVPALDVLASSPLTRARQTADIVQEAYGKPRATIVDALSPGREPEDVGDWLSLLPVEAKVAAVGHEPDLSELVGWLTTGEPHGFVAMKKGGACLLEIATAPGACSARIEWLLTPRQLRLLAGE
ncbi:MAG: phosphohistidine phosphatase SixA [Gammaproteobacteria bacterium]|jgi:phosphohistidine phosphatase|nr:phosphohistidine phosphatase SixA [Gammaproteobacteria bacterium]